MAVTRQLPRLLANAVLVAAAIALALLLAWPFLQDPSRLAHTRDPAWYTWRTRMVLGDDPSFLLEREGPFGILTGGYRIATPVLGALLHRVAGIDLYRFTILLEVGIPVLTSMALAGFAYRHKRDRWAFMMVLAVAVPLFATVPFIGYMDNLLSLLFLSLSLYFLAHARTSWGSRVTVSVLLFLAMLTHVPATMVFVLVLLAGAGARLLAYRFSFRRVLESEGPLLAAVAVGVGVGLGAWLFGLWGPPGPLSEAAVPQPYTAEVFERRLGRWLRGLPLEFVLPLAGAGVAWVAGELARRRSVDRLSEVAVIWSAPLLGTLGFTIGLTYPYYRFINVALGHLLLAGLGAWAITRVALWVGRRVGDRWRLLQTAVGVLLLVGVALFVVRPGARTWGRQGPWINRDVRLAVAAAGAYAGQGESPIVFVVHPRPAPRSWGNSKQSTNFILGALESDQIRRAHVFVGTVEDFLARRPTRTGDPTFDRISPEFLEHLMKGLEEAESPAVAFALPSLYRAGTPPPPEAVEEIVPNLLLLRGPGLAQPSEAAAVAAREAFSRETLAARGEDPGFTARHVARLGLGLAVLLVIPGLLASRWVGLEGFPAYLAVVPGLSLALCVAAGVLVVSVQRGPFGPGSALASVVLAVLASSAMGAWSFRTRRRTAPSPAPTSADEAREPEVRVEAETRPGPP